MDNGEFLKLSKFKRCKMSNLNFKLYAKWSTHQALAPTNLCQSQVSCPLNFSNYFPIRKWFILFYFSAETVEGISKFKYFPSLLSKKQIPPTDWVKVVDFSQLICTILQIRFVENLTCEREYRVCRLYCRQIIFRESVV